MSDGAQNLRSHFLNVWEEKEVLEDDPRLHILRWAGLHILRWAGQSTKPEAYISLGPELSPTITQSE